MAERTKIGGISLTAAQLERMQAVFHHPEFARTRKVITLYKADDGGLALFRREAGNVFMELAARGVTRRKLTTPLRRYVHQWMNDANPMFREAFAALNEALGYQFLPTEENHDGQNHSNP